MGFLLPQHGEGAADDAEQVVAGHPDKHRLERADVVRIEELNPACRQVRIEVTVSRHEKERERINEDDGHHPFEESVPERRQLAGRVKTREPHEGGNDDHPRNGPPVRRVGLAVREPQQNTLAEEPEERREKGVAGNDDERGLDDQRTAILAFCREVGRIGKDGEGEGGREEPGDVGESRHHVVGGGVNFGEPLAENRRFDEVRESSGKRPDSQQDEDGRKTPDDFAVPVGFGGNGQLLAQGNDRADDAEGGRGGLADEIAGEGAERHRDEHCQEPHRCADERDE